MPEGTGLDKLRDLYPQRFFDVGIAEGHALCFAGGLAKAGLKPVVAIYSTFLQRGYDQIVEAVALQNLGAILAVDRAGIVGGDGATHQGILDVVFLRSIPHLVIMAPKDARELEEMLEFAIGLGQPVAIRYPKDKAPHFQLSAPKSQLKLGKSEVLREGKDIAIIALGSMVLPSLSAAEILAKEGIDAWVVNSRFVKHLDAELFKDIGAKVKFIFTVEEGILAGGFGSAVLEIIDKPVIRMGLPCEFIPHGARDILLSQYGLTAQGIVDKIKSVLW